MRKITVLGSTGSIGVSTLDVIGQLGGREAFEVLALTAMAISRCSPNRRWPQVRSSLSPPAKSSIPN